MFLISSSSCSCLCPMHWSQVISWKWRCSPSSTNRRCSNYIWVINNFIVYWGVACIRVLMVRFLSNLRALVFMFSQNGNEAWVARYLLLLEVNKHDCHLLTRLLLKNHLKLFSLTNFTPISFISCPATEQNGRLFADNSANGQQAITSGDQDL